MKYEKNEERQDRLSKIALGALAIGASAFLLKESGGFKHISKFLSDSSSTLSSMSNDLAKLSFKELDAKNLTKIVKDGILDENSTWKKLSKKSINELDFRVTSSKSLFSSISKLTELKNNTQVLKEVMFENNLTSEIVSELAKETKSESKDFLKELNKVVTDIVSNKNKYFEKLDNESLSFIEDELAEKFEDSLLKEQKDIIAKKIEDKLNNSSVAREKFDDLFENKLKDEFYDNFLNNIKEDFSNKDFSIGKDRAMLVNDLLDAIDTKQITLGNEDPIDIINKLRELRNEDNEIGKLLIDKEVLRVGSNNELYSLKGLTDLKNNIIDEFADTIPGKLFGARSIVERGKAPNFFYIGKGSFDPILGSLEDSTSGVLKNDYFKLGSKFYKFDGSDLSYVKEADNLKLVSGRHGNEFSFLNKIAGNADEVEVSNSFLKWLDIGTTKGNAFRKNISGFEKFKDEDWIRNVSRRILEDYSPEDVNDDNIVRQFYKDMKTLNNTFNNVIEAPDKKTIHKIKKHTSGKSTALLDILTEDNDDIANAILTSDKFEDNLFRNKDLKSLLNKYKKEMQDVDSTVHIGKGVGQKNILKYNDMLKREVFKEAMLQQSDLYGGSIRGYAATVNLIEKSDLSGDALKRTKNITNWAFIQKESDLYSRSFKEAKSISEKKEIFNSVNKLIQGQDNNRHYEDYAKKMRKEINDLIVETSSIFNTMPEKNVKEGFKTNKWMTMRSMITPLDVIKDLNDTTKMKKMVKQLYAGRNNMQDVTTATIFPFHYLNRLTSSLEGIGLGFSNINTGSVGDLAKNIAFKRILPVTATMYAASYLDFEFKKITGTGLNESFENTKARFALGTKVIGKALGLDDNHRRSRIYNPFAKYYFGEYRDYDEQLDYYERGYDPVRKGRWWSFGSASEFRGGKISYWQPNSLRRAHSNYKDISIYGSSEEKWKHSLIPTPRYPLAPLNFILNPYWLENKHSEDRPYPVSGKLFSEGTPWGAVLNPTIGEIIKPQKRMHQKELQGTMLDVRAIIQERNRKTFEKANNRLISIGEKGIKNVAYNPTSYISSDEQMYSIKIENGNIVSAGFEGADYTDNLNNINDAILSNSETSENNTVNSIKTAENFVKHNISDNRINRLIANTILSAKTFVGKTGAVKDNSIMYSTISQVNNDIFSRARQKRSGYITDKPNLAYVPARQAAYSQKTDYLENMVEYNPKKSYVHDLMYSASELSGAYGFLADTIFTNSKGYKLEESNKMTSFSRTFWDASVGGHGGEFMEIARRFFPHEDHNIEQVNPIMNTMPDWMPIRFKTGDPYVKLPKGEARLPGAGYESLNKLHSDRYGRYGAFDRYKILADIAPLSQEYKLWKDIANKEVDDPNLKKQMEDIEKRAKEQIKEHDFYDYKFLGKNLKSYNAIISDVTDKGAFKILGSDEQYTLAGVNPLKNSETEQSYIHEYLRPGMKVKLKYEDNDYRKRNDKGQISALVYADGDSISKKMFENKTAKEKNNKETLADEYFSLKDSNISSGKFFELLSHAQIPFFHDKFWRIDTTIDTYKKEQVYGTPYSSWSHPIKTFIKPSFQKSWARGPVAQMFSVGAFALSKYAESQNWSKITKTAMHSLFAFSSPASFAGATLGSIAKMNIGKNTLKGARIGAIVGLAGYAFTSAENPFLSIGNFAAIGYAAAKQLKIDKISGGKGAMIGAAVGLGLSALKNPGFSLNKLTEKYIPKDTKKKWEVEEYFDRLEYIKYTNLYEQSARKAALFERTNIKKIINKYEYNREKNEKKIEKLEKEKAEIKNNVLDENLKNTLIEKIDLEIESLSVPEQVLTAGKHTIAALAYKKAADTTIYGLNKHSSMSDILRALPKYDRDFFLEFAKEKDPKDRKKILKYVSPYKQKALKLMWGEEYDDLKSNSGYFNNYKLPNLFWSGWKSDVDLDNVKMKTIENEGLLLSDFGMYESQKNEPAAQYAPEIESIHAASSSLAVKSNLFGLLNGAGFTNLDISVEETNIPGTNVITNITRVAQYKLQNAVGSVFSTIF